MESEKFVPRGAIAFFFILMALAAIIWFGVYFLMLSRA
ncbi:MAG: cytochrome c oxidase subunit 2A [Saprospiraceae bacterium]|nr:cytochrome c oxidase subunit 2A [Saprospiraceae bacterium]